MIVMLIPGHEGIAGYRVIVDPMIANGCAIIHPSRTIVFALKTARSMCRRTRRHWARARGRRAAVRMPPVPFAVALGAALEAAKEPKR